MKMNPGIKTQWLAALRSGQYEQCFDGEIRSFDPDTNSYQYSCDGVLVALYLQATQQK